MTAALKRLTRGEMSAEELVYGLGVAKLGLPFPWVRRISDGIDASRNAPIFLRHRRAARALLHEQGQARGVISRTAGCAPIDQASIPRFAEMMRAARAIFDAKWSRVQMPAGEPYVDYIDADDLSAHPVLFEVACAPEVTAVITDYLGTFPQLRNISMLVSTPAASPNPFSSMEYHLDKLDCGMVGLWINVIDVAEENGPFHFIPADLSAQVCRSHNYMRQSYRGYTRVTDRQLDSVLSDDGAIAITGPAGTNGWFVDTSRCLHMGGRCRAGVRATLHIRYCLPHKIGPTYRHRFAGCSRPNQWSRMLLQEE